MKNVEKIKPSGIFTNYIYKTIPLAFDESMSYYETLCGILSLLKDTIEPTINNNADALIELQEYVTHYFDNLDVQEEINNKLDEMAEDGTLAAIIAEFLNSNALLYYNSVSEMKMAENLIAGQFVETKGFYSVGDGGSAKYLIREKNENETSNEITTFNLLDETLIAELLIKDRLNILQLGCKGDGTTEHQELKIQAGIEFMQEKYGHVNLFIPDGTYYINYQWYLRNGENYGIMGLRIHSNTIIEGESLNAILKAQTNTYGPGVIYGLIRSDMDDNCVSNVIIKNITIDGSSETHNAGNTGETNILLNVNKNILIDNVSSINCKGCGIYINGRNTVIAENISVNNCYVNNCSNIGIEVGRFKKLTITDNKVTNCTNNGIDIYGMLPDGDGPIATEYVISNNIVDTTLVGIFPETTKNGQVSNNVILNSSEGIHINSGYNLSKDVDITNNFINNCTVGVDVTGATQGIDIHENEIKNCSNRPFILNTASEVNIYNNKIKCSNTNALLECKGDSSSFNRFIDNILDYSSSAPSKIVEFAEGTVITRVIYNIINPNYNVLKTVANSNNQFCAIDLPAIYDSYKATLKLLFANDEQYTTYEIIKIDDSTFKIGNKNNVYITGSDKITNQSIYQNVQVIIFTTAPSIRYTFEIEPIIKK